MTHQRQHLCNSLATRILESIDSPTKRNVIALSGEAGIGKSTLLHNLQNFLLSNPSNSATALIIGTAQCSAPLAGQHLGSVEALQPWAHLLSNLVEQSSSRKVASLVKDLAKAWIKFVPIVGDIIESTADTLEVIREHRGSHAVSTSDDVNALNEQQIFQQYINVLSKTAADARLICILDDAHWADESSLNLLFTAARQLRHLPVIFLLAHRDADVLSTVNAEPHPLQRVRRELQRYELLDDVLVPSMDAGDIDALLRARYAAGYTDNDELEVFIATSSNGNPLFITSWLDQLERDGQLDRIHGKLLEGLHSITIPQTIRAVLQQRLQSLSREAYDLLRYASVEGVQFSAQLLATVSETSTLKILQQLRHIEADTGVIQSRGKVQVLDTETTVFAFHHVILRDLLYESLLEEERDIIHDIVLDQLQTLWENPALSGERRANLALRRATHAAVVKKHTLSAEAWLYLAQWSWKSYSRAETRTALQHVQLELDAVANVDDASRRVRAQAFELLADVEIMESSYDDALHHLRRAAESYAEVNDDAQEIDCLIRIGATESRRSNVDAAIEAAVFALSRAEARGFHAGCASAQSLLGVLHETRGAFDLAESCYRTSIALAEETGQTARLATALMNQGRLYMIRTLTSEAHAAINKSIDLFVSINHLPGQARGLNMLGILSKDAHDYDAALEYLTRSMAIDEQIGDLDAAASVNTNIGILLFDQQLFDEALPYFARSVAIKEQVHDRMGLGVALHGYGSVLDQLNLHDEALQQHERALGIFTEMGEVMWCANAEYGLGMHYLSAGDLDRGEHFLTTARNRAESIHAQQTLDMIQTGFDELALLRAKLG